MSLYIGRCSCTEWVLLLGIKKAPCGWCNSEAEYVSNYDGRDDWVRRMRDVESRD